MICFVYIFFTAWFKFHWAEGDRTPLVICCTIMALLCWALPPRHWDNSSHFTMINNCRAAGASQGGWGHRGDLRADEARREGLEDSQVSKLLWLCTGALHLHHICSASHTWCLWRLDSAAEQLCIIFLFIFMYDPTFKNKLHDKLCTPQYLSVWN